jgi:hypothetical protein
MGQYKEANERMNNTGDGLEGIEFVNFQDYIVNNICKYYFLLDPVLKERPNVRPWFTNEDMSNDIEFDTAIELSSSDDESMASKENYFNTCNEDDSIALRIMQEDTRAKGSDDEYISPDSNITNPSPSSNHNFSTPTNVSGYSSRSTFDSPTGSARNVVASIIQPTPRMSTGIDKSSKTKMSPMQAKNYQKELLKKKKKTIVKKKNKKETVNEDHEFIKEGRDAKMKFEKDKYDYMKNIESEKLRIDQVRLKMEQDGIEIKQQQEKSRSVLLRLQIFRERQELKKQYPDLTDDYLEATFPYTD